MTLRCLLFSGVFFCWAIPALAGNLPDPNLTPGAVLPNVTPEQLCRPDYPKSVPPLGPEVRAKVLAEYGLDNDHAGYCDGPDGCVIDHLIGIGLGGSNDLSNLWPEPADGEWNAHLKKRLDAVLEQLVCAGRMPLEEAHQAVADDWIAAYRQYIGEPPDQ
jgi:hypothetical protein